MATEEQHKLAQAFAAHIRDGGRVVLVDTKDKQGHDATVLCVMFDGGETYPVARMFASNDPTDELETPEGAELHEPLDTVQ